VRILGFLGERYGRVLWVVTVGKAYLLLDPFLCTHQYPRLCAILLIEDEIIGVEGLAGGNVVR
jgi:hypothetical protein